MPDPSNNSFIPKRGPVPRGKHGPASRRVYLFTIVSYIVLFSTLLASGGIYFYTNHVTQQRDLKIIELNQAITSFSEANMREVLEFDERLRQASGRVNASVSVLSILRILEEATLDTVTFESLTLTREADDAYALAASVYTDTFDSTIFQRDTYSENQMISNVSVSGLSVNVSEEETPGVKGKTEITFDVNLKVPVQKILYTPSSEPVTIKPATLVEDSITAASSSSEEAVDEVSNEETI